MAENEAKLPVNKESNALWSCSSAHPFEEAELDKPPDLFAYYVRRQKNLLKTTLDPQDQRPVETRHSYPQRGLYVMAAIIIGGLAGLAASFGFRNEALSPPETATIKAQTGFAKLQPERVIDADVPAQDASVPQTSPQPSPAATVDNAKQAVAASRAQEKTPPTIALRGDEAHVTQAASVPAPPAHTQTQAEPLASKEMWDLSVRRMAHFPPPSTPKTAARVRTTPKPAAAAKLGDRGQRVYIVKKAKAKSTARVEPEQVVNTAAEAPAPQPAPPPPPSEPFAFMQSAVDSLSGGRW
jgi:hypothetical protein